MTFDFCVGTPPPPPLNDSCTGAEVLAVQPNSCTTWTTVDNSGATDSGSAIPSCGLYQGGDLWYEVTVPASGNITFDVQNVNWFSAAASLYSGSCPALVEDDCTQLNSGWPFVFTSIPPGDYILRIWEFGNSSAATVELCAFATTCLITDIAVGNQTNCNPSTGTYDQDIIVSYIDAPASGSLVVNGQSFTITTSPQTVTLLGMAANLAPVDISVRFSALNTCLLDSLALYTAPAPCITNDSCHNAIPVVINADETCTILTTGSTIGATFGNYFPCWGNPNDNVWYSFVAASTIHHFDLLNVTTTSSSSDMVHAVYSGGCAGLTQILCSNSNSSTSYDLIVGNTYYIEVYSYSHDQHASQTFDLCVGTPPAAPPNDSCGGAYPLPINPDLSCTVFGSGNTEFAYQSQSGCIGTADDDVWFSFVATSSSHLFEIFNVVPVIGSSSDMAHEVFSGTCGSLTSIGCSDPNTSMVSNLTVGDTYFVRVYNYYSSSRDTFDICIKTLPPAEPNDTCANAIMTPVNSDLNCASVVSGSTMSASQSLSGCTGTANDDVWFAFVATSPYHSFDVLNVTTVLGTSTNMVHELYSGTCGALTSLLCSDPNSSTISGLTVGNTYYVRVYSYSTTSSQTFDLCIGTPPAPPVNDICSGALPLTVQVNSCDSITIGDNSNTTNSGELPTPSCGNYQGFDIWYEIIVPASGNVSIDLNKIGWSTTAGVLYSGTCGNLVQEGPCTASNSTWPVAYSGLTPGPHYLRVYDFSGNDFGPVEICAFTLVCDISNLTQGDIVGCDSIANTFSKEVGVYFANPPSSGTLDVNGQSFPITGTSFQWVTLTGLPIGGGLVDVTASFSADTACTYTELGVFVGMPVCAPPPPNDFCEDAIPLDSCIIGDNSTATTGLSYNTSCGDYQGGDLWYIVEVPPSGNLTIDFPNLTWSDIALELGETGCNDELWIADCRDTSTGPPFHFSGIDPGSQLVRIWNPGHDELGQIQICVSEPVPCSIDSITVGTQAACDSLAGTYSQDLVVWYNNITVPSDLSVNGQLFPVTTSPQTITLTNLPANGQPVTVEAYGEGTVDCDFLEFDMFTAPDCSLSSQCGPYSSTTNAITVSGTASIITDLNVLIEMDPDYIDYYQFILKSPSGTQVTLWNYQCNGYSDFEILFDDEGMPLNCNSTIGVYIPFQSLASFDGEPFDGTWTLLVDFVEEPPFNLQWCMIPELAPATPLDNCGDHTSATGNTIPALGMYTETITVSGSGDSLLDLNLIVSIDDTFSNYEIELTSPAGTVVSLYTAQCALTEDLEVEFDDEALLPITCASPTLGSYLPVNSLSAFDGEEFNGDWEIKITNLGAAPAILEQWCLVPEILGACEFSSTPGATIGANGLDDIITIAGTGGVVSNLSILVELDHPNLADVGIALISPYFDFVILKDFGVCSGSSNLDAEFSDSGNPIICGSPTTGIILSEESLAMLNGLPLDGDWTLSLFDDSESNLGTLVKWCIIPGIPRECEFSSAPGKEIDEDGRGGPGGNVFGPPIVYDTISVSGTGATLNDLNVYVNIYHNAPDQLDIELISPTGVIVPLMLSSCFGTENIDVEFDDEGGLLICSTPTAGVFVPAGLLSDFDGLLFDGDWILRIEDNFPGSGAGTLAQWCLFPEFLTLPTENCGSYTNSPGTDILDNVTIYDTITVSGAAPLLDLNVVLNVEHSYLEDLEIVLTSPSGTSVTLMQYSCDDNEDFEIEFDDEAGGPLLICSTPTVGAFVPFDSLSAFDGEIFDGDWIISIYDDAAGDEGTLLQWCLIPELGKACDYTSAPGTVIDVDPNEPPIILNFAPPIVWDTITVAGTGNTLSDLNVFVNIDHTYVEDLNIELTSPSGTTIPLILGECGDNDDLEVEFDDEGIPLLCSTPTVGVFQPDGLLSDFDGEPFDGDWILKIEDTFVGEDGGVLNQWCVIPEFALPACPLDSITSTPVSCNGLSDGTATVFSSDTIFTYTWDNGDTTQTASNLSSGTHQVTVVNTDGCVAIDSVVITESSPLSIAQVVTFETNCPGSSDGSAIVIVVGGTTPYSYIWDNGETTSTADSLTAGAHSVTISDANGCSIVESPIGINSPQSLSVTVSSVDISCNGLSDGSASFSVQPGPTVTSHYWSDGSTGPTVTGLSPGFHNVTFIYGKNCQKTESFLITQPMPLAAESITTTGISCSGADDGTATITVTGGTPIYGSYNFTWDNGDTTATATGLSGGMHSVTVVDMNGCSFVENSVQISQAVSMEITDISSTAVSCSGVDNGTATVMVSGGTPGYTYTWDSGQNSPLGQTSATVTGLAAGVYNVTVEDVNGCSVIGFIEVTVSTDPALIVYLDTDEVSCGAVSDGQGTVTPSYGTPPYTYQWDANAGNQTTATATGLALGTYVMTVTDDNGCYLIDGVLIDQTPCDYCQIAEDNNTDICAVLTADPSDPLSSLDCDGDGVTSGDECNDNTSPSDPCDFEDGSITGPVTADQSDCINLCQDLTVITTLIPANIAGLSPISVRIDIVELNSVDAGPQPILVRMPSDPRLTFTWNTAMNPNWIYGGDNGLFHSFTYVGNNGILFAGSTESITIGLADGKYDPQGTDGLTTLSPSLVPFSGGECLITNNTDAETLVYFR